MKILNVLMLSLLLVMCSCGKDDAVIEIAMMNAKVDGARSTTTQKAKQAHSISGLTLLNQAQKQ
jgi:hypothetical protein